MTAEASLYPKFGRFLQNRGWRVAYQIPPRPGSPRRFDIVGVKPRKEEVTVVEVKVKDFRRALDQAKSRQFVADFVYVGFPLPYAKRVFRDRALDLEPDGVGLLGLRNRVHELVVPRPSKIVDPQRRKRLLKMVSEERVDK